MWPRGAISDGTSVGELRNARYHDSCDGKNPGDIRRVRNEAGKRESKGTVAVACYNGRDAPKMAAVLWLSGEELWPSRDAIGRGKRGERRRGSGLYSRGFTARNRGVNLP